MDLNLNPKHILFKPKLKAISSFNNMQSAIHKTTEATEKESIRWYKNKCRY